MTMASGVYGRFIRDLGNGSEAFDLDTDAFLSQLVTDTHTPDFDADEVETDIDNEISGTGYTSGGESLASPTWTLAADYCTWDGNDMSLSNSTLTNVRGEIFLDDTLTNDPLVAATTFGSDFSTVNGTFSVARNANGIWRVKFDPSA